MKPSGVRTITYNLCTLVLTEVDGGYSCLIKTPYLTYDHGVIAGPFFEAVRFAKRAADVHLMNERVLIIQALDIAYQSMKPHMENTRIQIENREKLEPVYTFLKQIRGE